ncbi:MAG: S9 family peptidase, partial [Stenotrophomonas nitritireducens]|nr:S9 family peptidase [Stenotrophomonas nitritireducens]
MWAAHAGAAVDIGQFIRKDEFNEIKISPTGEYYAATVPLEDRTALVIFTRDGLKSTGMFRPMANAHVNGFEWVNDQRVLISIAQKFGMLDQPQPTGEIYAINADGGQVDLLVGFRVQGNGAGTRIQPKKVEDVAAFLIDVLPGDDRNAVIAVWPLMGDDPFTRAERLDVRSGRRITLARAPVRRASFVTDADGEVRLAYGANVDNVEKLYYRDATGADWRLVNDPASSGRVEIPLGFSQDNRLAYLRVRGEDSGTDRIVAWDPASNARTTMLHHAGADPLTIIHRNGTSIPVGAQVMDGRHRNLFFDDDSPEARQYRSLEAAFPDQSVRITSSTRDGKLLLIRVWSGNSPGDFYLFDTEQK